MSKELILTQEEFDLIDRQYKKILDHKVRSSPRDARRKEDEYKLLAGLKARFTKPGSQRLNRNDLRAIEGICNVGKKALEELIIPGYNERISKTGDDAEKERYQGYIDRANLTLATYNAILIKVEAML